MPQCPSRKSNFQFYRYDPSLAAAAIFTALFAISSLLHMWQTWKKRSWFMIAFIVGGWFEAIGYIGRMLSANNPCISAPYIMQTLLLLLGPALFAASIYMILGRIILLTSGEKYSFVRRTWLTKIFVGGDFISFLMQAAGGGIMSGSNGDKNKRKLGEVVIVASLFVQLFFFGVFVIAAVIFQKRGKEHLKTVPKSITWKKHLYVLYFISGLILIRSAFRVIEYLQGNDGFLLRKEVFLFIFDSVLMLAVMVAMNVVHPGDIAFMLKEKAHGGDFLELGMDGRKHDSAESATPLHQEGRH